MRHNWMEGSFNLIEAKSALVSQCEEHRLQRAIGEERTGEERNYCRERERRGEVEILRKEKTRQQKNNSYSQRSRILNTKCLFYQPKRFWEKLHVIAPNLFTKHNVFDVKSISQTFTQYYTILMPKCRSDHTFLYLSLRLFRFFLTYIMCIFSSSLQLFFLYVSPDPLFLTDAYSFQMILTFSHLKLLFRYI